MRKGWVIGLGALVLAAGGAAYRFGGPYIDRYINPPTEAAAQAAPAPRAFAMPVEAVTVAVEHVDLTIPAVGSLKSDESVTLSPEIAGRVIEIPVEEGQAVKAGTVIARFDQSVHEAEIAQAAAAVELGRSNFERASELLKKKAGTERARDEARSAMLTAEANLALARARFDKMTLTAPFDGVLGLRQVSVGQYLNPGDAIIRLEAIDPLKVDFRVPEVYFTRVSIGQTINAEVDAFPGETIQGTVYAIDPLVDENGRSVVIRAKIPNEQGRLRPGLFARVALVYDSIEQAIIVPEQAIVPIGTDKFVFRVVDGKAALTRIELGQRFLGRVQVKSGLAAGDSVITAGQLKIQDGVPVAVVPAAGAAAAAAAEPAEG